MAFSDRVKALRTSYGFTQKEFAATIGLSSASIIAYERGEKKPSFDVLMSIAGQWHVSLDWLCDIKGHKFSQGLSTVGEFVTCVTSICGSNIVVRITENEEHTGIEFNRYNPKNGDFEIIGSNWHSVFLEEYKKIFDLWRAGTITNELYELWVMDFINKHGDEPLTD